MAPENMYVLYEHASGYALFKVKEFEEIEMHSVEQSVIDLSRFNSVVKLVAFSPFKTGTNALDNMNSISEGILHEDLRLFVETNVPKSSKKHKNIVGVGDPKIGASISEELGISCTHIGVIPEILRGIRMHFSHMVKGLTDVAAGKAQLGLGHSYSRAKVKFNVNRADNMIIQSISLLDQLDKDINTFSMRIREWYSYHFPELVRIVGDNLMFATVAKYFKNRKEFTEDMLEGLEDIVMDSAKAKAIYDASRSSMGMDIASIDLINIERFASRVIALCTYRKQLHGYLSGKMAAVAPNLKALIGDQVGARLISHAGSLTNLAKYPASTVQILGAEKALFRALKTRGNTPKYGLIFHSTFIGRAGAKNKGRISRYLANKCSIASRIDCFSEIPTALFGEHLRDQVEDRLKFYETGEAPKKNVDVMKVAIEEVAEELIKSAKKEKKKKKKDKKRKFDESTAGDTTLETTAVSMVTEGEEHEPAKKKKKNKVNHGADETMDTTAVSVVTEEEEQEPTRKKKKKEKHETDETMDTRADVTMDTTTDDMGKSKKKKKKSKVKEDIVVVEAAVEADTEETPSKKKRHKKKKNADN